MQRVFLEGKFSGENFMVTKCSNSAYESQTPIETRLQRLRSYIVSTVIVNIHLVQKISNVYNKIVI